MKLMHTTTVELNTREFNRLSSRIIDSLYDVSPEIVDLYDIHINFIEDTWQVDFVPYDDHTPLLKVTAHTEYDDTGKEVLKITPTLLSELPSKIKLHDNDSTFDLCMDYMGLFRFIAKLPDWEYRL